LSIDDETIPDYASMGDLGGRVAVVIGAGQGIGGHVAHALAAAGARVACVDLNLDLARELADAVSGVPIQADVRQGSEVQRVLDGTIAQFGTVDAVVDIVGLGKFGSVLEFTDEDWQDSYDVNFRHVALVTRIFGKHFTENCAGSMVFIGSISGIVSSGNNAAYGAFKSAIHSLVRSAAVEFGPHNVRVNAVAPGLTATPRVVAHLPNRDLVGRLGGLTGPGGLTRPEDIANAAYFLCSDRATMITGQTLVVDAGQTLRFPIELPSGVVSAQSAAGQASAFRAGR
jgi:3-oxoacyl-[acyl-carrier protein] reductase